MDRNTVVIIDYGAGNLGSVVNAIAELGYQPRITSNPGDLSRAAAVVLPGVGAAGDAMEGLNNSGMADAIRETIFANRPLFAVCVGLQLLFSQTEEGGGHRCLNVIPGAVKRLPSGVKTPHMGWNQVKQQLEHPIFSGIPDKANFYFVHSYYAEPVDTSVVAGTTEYGVAFCSMVIKNNLIATQFHPEKSGKWGLQMYANFFKIAFAGGK